MKTVNASDYVEVAPLILQTVRAKRDVCSAEMQLAFYRLEETRARLRLHSVQLKNADRRLSAAQLEIGRVCALMRRKGCPTSLIGCPGQSTTCGRSIPLKGRCEPFSPLVRYPFATDYAGLHSVVIPSGGVLTVNLD